MFRHLTLVFAACLCPKVAAAHGAVHERLAAVELQLAESPKDPSLFLQRAALFHEHGDQDKALEDLRTVERLDTDLDGRFLLEARIRSDSGKHQMALDTIAGLLEKKPNHIEGLSVRCGILENLGRNQEAIRDARKVIELAPEPELQQHMRLIRMLKKHGDRAEIDAAFSAARKSLGNMPVLLQQEAEWLGEIGKRQEATAIYAQLREIVPGLAFPLHVEEVRLWKDHDRDRARLAVVEAERAWSALSPSVRSRDAMRAKHRELQRLKDSS